MIWFRPRQLDLNKNPVQKTFRIWLRVFFGGEDFGEGGIQGLYVGGVQVAEKVGLDAADVGWEGLGEDFFALFGDDGVGSAPVVGAGEALYQPGGGYAVQEAGQAALAQENGFGQVLHAQDAVWGAVQLGQHVVPGEG